MNYFDPILTGKTPIQAKLESVFCSFEVLKAVGIDRPATGFTCCGCHFRVIETNPETGETLIETTDLGDGSEGQYRFPTLWDAIQYFKGL